MTRDEAQKEYIKLLNEKMEKEDEIVKRAKESGVWKMGLDGNRDLFKDLDDEYKKKIKALKKSIVEE